MHTTTTAARRRARRARALVALPAAAALAFGLFACGRDDGGSNVSEETASSASGDEQGTGNGPGTAVGHEDIAGEGDADGSATGSDSAGGTAAGEVPPEGNAPEHAGAPEDAPPLDNAALLLTAEDFPGMQFQAVSPESTAEAMQAYEALAASMTFDPPECADATNVASRLPDNTAMANISDDTGTVAFTIGVLGTGVDTREFADQNKRCKIVRMSGAGITGETRTTQIAGPAIDGTNVQAFDVVSTSRVDALNKEQSQAVANYQITTRGVTFRVAATQLTAEIGPEVRSQLDDIARRQAEKIRNS